MFLHAKASPGDWVVQGNACTPAVADTSPTVRPPEPLANTVKQSARSPADTDTTGTAEAAAASVNVPFALSGAPVDAFSRKAATPPPTRRTRKWPTPQEI